MQQAETALELPSPALREVIEGAYACRAAGDAEGVMAFMDSDVEYAVIGSIAGQPLVPRLQGKAKVSAHYTTFLMRWDLSGMQIQKVIIDGGVAVIETQGTMRYRVTGQAFETSACDVLEFKQGLITRVRCYSDTFTIVRIAGLAL
ncbi:MAG: Ketosteroid isomerase-like [Beijerinckiaceae bacterium]|nr:MAG: Ketosteroid isomerase-like [Beijerinckiaceae bacterium]